MNYIELAIAIYLTTGYTGHVYACVESPPITRPLTRAVYLGYNRPVNRFPPTSHEIWCFENYMIPASFKIEN